MAKEQRVCPLCGSHHTCFYDSLSADGKQPFSAQQCSNVKCKLPCNLWDKVTGLHDQIGRLQIVISTYTDYQPEKGLIQPIKPRHGNVFYCKTCGQWHDGCVCEHNAIHLLLKPEGSHDDGK